MFDQLEALAALQQHGTMRAAGTELRISQSAVSKRIAALEDELEKSLVERRGRRAYLTPDGERLLDRVGPLLAELKAALSEDAIQEGGRLVIGVSDSLLSAWGAHALAEAARALPDLDLELHAHRSPVAIDRVRSGEYALALCAGLASTAPDLVCERLLDEPMVIVPSGLRRFRFPRRGTLSVLTLETHSETWRSIAARARALRIEPGATVENAFSVAQMAVAGLGHGLVPLGVVEALRIPNAKVVRPPKGGLSRPIALVSRKSTFGRPLVRRFVEVLQVKGRRSALR